MKKITRERSKMNQRRKFYAIQGTDHTGVPCLYCNIQGKTFTSLGYPFTTQAFKRAEPEHPQIMRALRNHLEYDPTSKVVEVEA